MKRLLFTLAILFLSTAIHANPPRVTIRAKVAADWLEGMPLAWSQSKIHLLARDGRLHEFAPDKATEYSQTSDQFSGLTASEVRGRLQREFGNTYDVSGTGHYLVVHPAGQRDYWAERFEDLYRSFVHYFSVRGWRIREPEFPLVAICVRQAADMQAYAAAEGMRLPAGVLGYYSPLSNRVILYDQGGGKAAQKDWAENSATLIHETAHQTAFNTGVHSRYTMPPRWVVEGLGTLFEAPGVWNSRLHPDRTDRINRGRMKDFSKGVAPKLTGGLLHAMVASDEFYQTQPGPAYATGWALTFYLVETQPGKYCQFLAKTANRKPFEEYSPQDRLADFKAIFGDDFSMLAARVVRFIGEQQ